MLNIMMVVIVLFINTTLGANITLFTHGKVKDVVVLVSSRG